MAGTIYSLDAAPLDELGGKGAGLRRLAAAGLPVPPTLVIPASASASEALPGGLDGALAALGTPLIARSSAASEDVAGGAPPGLFASVGDIGDAAALAMAVRRVWASARSPLALAVLAQRGLPPPAMAVMLQRQQPGRAATIYTRRPGADDELLVELATPSGTPAVAILGRDGAPRATLPPGVDVVRLRALAELALAAEAAIDAAATGADVEAVLGESGITLVQARAIAPGPPAAPLSAPAPAGIWRWDAAHNPEPLSAAQAGLVALVEAAGASSVEQRVIDDWLYVGPARPSPTPAPPQPSLEALAAPLARLDAEPPPTLDEALAAYVAFSAAYAALSPSLAAPRRALCDALATRFGARAQSLAGRLLAGVGAVASPDSHASVTLVWDVAHAPVAVAPAPHDAGESIASARALLDELAAPLPAAEAARLSTLVAEARAAAALAEQDDLFFARAQAGVRAALERAAATLGVRFDDLVQLPLDETRHAIASGRAPADLAARAAAARARLAERARTAPPPLLVDGRAAIAPTPPGPAELLRGHGAGGLARGRVARLSAQAATQVPAGAVVLLPTILPGLAALVAGRAAALVAEHGGLLGHGAALARELGLPFVVGASGALERLAEGDEVLVDGDAGLVLRLGRA